MNRVSNKTFLLCCIVGVPMLHAMDDTPKVVNFEQANKELLQDMDHLMESGDALHKELEQSDIQREEYMDILFKRQTMLADELIHIGSSKKLTRDESRAYTKMWVETIENIGKIKVFLDLKMIKHPQVQVDVSSALNELQGTVDGLIEHDRLTVAHSKKQEPNQFAIKLREICNGIYKQ